MSGINTWFWSEEGELHLAWRLLWAAGLAMLAVLPLAFAGSVVVAYASLRPANLAAGAAVSALQGLDPATAALVMGSPSFVPLATALLALVGGLTLGLAAHLLGSRRSEFPQG
ncbi:MAG: hypothetical protein GX605_10425 [Chloroflexi bacterium]|nr:hypothetical protein [Chloroflexota bacterium]